MLQRLRRGVPVSNKAEAEGGASDLPGDREAQWEGHAEHAAGVHLVDGPCSRPGEAQVDVSDLHETSIVGLMGGRVWVNDNDAEDIRRGESSMDGWVGGGW